MKFGNILNIALDKNNVSVSSLAKKLNVSDRTIYRWLKNTNEPDFETLCRISIILNIDFHDIIEISNDNKTEILNIAQDKDECYLLQAYRGLDIRQKKLYLKNARLFMEALNINKK